MTEISLPRVKRRRRRPMNSKERASFKMLLLDLLLITINLIMYSLYHKIISIIAILFISIVLYPPYKIVHNYIINGFIDE